MTCLLEEEKSVLLQRMLQLLWMLHQNVFTIPFSSVDWQLKHCFLNLHRASITFLKSFLVLNSASSALIRISSFTNSSADLASQLRLQASLSSPEWISAKLVDQSSHSFHYLIIVSGKFCQDSSSRGGRLNNHDIRVFSPVFSKLNPVVMYIFELRCVPCMQQKDGFVFRVLIIVCQRVFLFWSNLFGIPASYIVIISWFEGHFLVLLLCWNVRVLLQWDDWALVVTQCTGCCCLHSYTYM
ncbi:hypothetical protein STEG23_028069 [Scotinomys teguina]